MQKIAILVIILIVVSTGFFSGCNTATYDLNNFKIRLHSVDVHLSNVNYIEIWFYLNISNYKAEHYIIDSLKYSIYGNSHYFCERKICSFSCGNITLHSAFGQFVDTILLDDLTINSELNNSFMNRQPIRWSTSGELSLYDEYKLTGVTSVIKIPFDGLIYCMTEYS
jgi:hypothetical protein